MTAPPVRYLLVEGRQSARHLVSVIQSAFAKLAGAPVRTLCSRRLPAHWRIVREFRTHRVRRYSVGCPKCDRRLRRLNARGRL